MKTFKDLGFLILLSFLAFGLQFVSTANAATSLFFDDFTGPALNPMWTTNLPPAYCGSYPFGYTTPATYIGAPNYGFQTVGGHSVIRLTNTLGQLQRCGWGSASNFVAGDFRYDARYNTLIQSSTTSIDGFIEIWIIDATNSSRYDIISPFGGSYSAAPYFFVGSTIDGSFTQTPITYGSNTWYHLVLQCAPGQHLRASILNDDGTELVGQNLAHGAEAYGSGFRIALSQCIGGAGSSYPVDVAVDYVNLTTGSAESPPFITSQPTNQTVPSFSSASFTMTATGTPPLDYQWSFDGTNIIGATNSTLTLANVQPLQAGNYQVKVSNPVGSTNSAVATLVVLGAFPPSCDPVPSGIVAWWRGDSNILDSIGTNNGTVTQGTVGYAPAEVGLGFNFDGGQNRIVVPDAPALNFGPGQDFSIEAWISPLSDNAGQLFNGVMTILDKRQAPDTTHSLGYEFCLVNGQLAIRISDSIAADGIAAYGGPDLRDGRMHQVALTVVRNSPTGGNMYVDGALVAQFDPTSQSGDLSNTNVLCIGNHPTPGLFTFFDGRIDEPSIYNRALSSNEIAAIYSAGSAGKCLTPMPPVITSQPTNQTVAVGGTVAFSVTAIGTPPLYYQWSFDGTNIIDATNSTLALANVQINQAGNYQVTVSNAVGSTNSAVAVLGVNPASPSCDPVPSGIVAWWKGESNILDSIGANNGIVTEGMVGYAPAEVGLGFNFDGGQNQIVVPDAPSLNFGPGQDFSIEAWINPLSGNAGQLFNGVMTIVDKRLAPDTTHSWGYEFCLVNGQLATRISDSIGADGVAANGGPDLRDGSMHHVALTVVRNSPTGGNMYVDGALVAQFDPTSQSGDLSNTNVLRIGNHSTPGLFTFFDGRMDELSIYSRALSSNEVAAIYLAGSAGKCLTLMPSVITSQPTNQTVAVGGTVVFSVTATGTPPLYYQWRFDGTNIIDATNSTLALANVQLASAGNYQVTVSNAVGSTNSVVATLTVLAPLVITQQPQSETVPSFSSASFTVAASGPGPLSYQWRKNGTNLVDGGNVSGSATTNLILNPVSLSDAGNYDVLVSNPYATTNSAVVALTVPETVLSLGSTNAMSGSTIVVPVWMNALGVENAVLASVGYDPTKLTLQSVTGSNLTPVYTQTNNGYVGFAVVLNPGATFPAGSNEVADLVFTTLPVTNHATVNLTFGDVPTGRQVVDNNFDSLPVAYVGGTVALSPAEYEADVYPRTNGDSQVNIFDWIEEGRMVAGLDVPTNSDEFARADCAPRNGPNGKLTVADWVQAGRYALGLDPLTPVPPANSHTVAEAKPQGGPIPSRILTVASVSAQRGQTVNVPVLLVCATNENAMGMTIGYNTNLLEFVSATLSAEATSGRLNMNTKRLGEVGIALALSPGAAFTPGTNQVAVLQFTTSTSASGTASLTLDNTVVQLEVADNTANSLATAYVNGAIALPNQPALGVTATRGNLLFNWPLSSGAFQVQEANSPTGPWTTIMLPLVTNSANVTATCVPTNHQQFFRLKGQ